MNAIHAAIQAAEQRAQKAEAALERACEAADAILAPICAAVGRCLYEAPEDDLVCELAVDGVALPAKLFRELYEATERHDD